MGRQWKFGEIRGQISPWYRVCTKALFISKGSYGYGELKHVIFLLVQLTHEAVTGLPTTRFHSAPYRADNGNIGKFGGRYPHGAVFALRECLCQIEATGMESLKM